MRKGRDPIARFRRAWERARKSEPQRGTAVALATAAPDGAPSLRMVLLKDVEDDGFVFYTNYGSRKAAELEANPRGALCFYWSTLNMQVRVEGDVTRVSSAVSDAYFASRPRQSQLGARASRQSATLESRRALVARYLREKAEWRGKTIPRPEFWGGYRVAPDRIEFWTSRLGRLHDRELYERGADGVWTRRLLHP